MGVGGLAVALALKDTLSNLFSGFYVSLAGQIRPGDYIKLDLGPEGFVADIGWRTTTLKGPANNLIFIPNEKLAQAVVNNFHLPGGPLALSIPVTVDYQNDPQQVETILKDLVRSSQDIPGLIAEEEPSVQFIPGFGDTGLSFTLTCKAAKFEDQGGVQHELRKRIFRRFRETGIQMPIAARMVLLQKTPTQD